MKVISQKEIHVELKSSMKKERRREESPDPRPKEDRRLEFWRKDQQKEQEAEGKR